MYSYALYHHISFIQVSVERASVLHLMNVNKKHLLTSIEVSMRLIGSQEHGLAWFQDHVVEEVDGEAANVSGVLRVEAQQQITIAT